MRAALALAISAAALVTSCLATAPQPDPDTPTATAPPVTETTPTRDWQTIFAQLPTSPPLPVPTQTPAPTATADPPAPRKTAQPTAPNTTPSVRLAPVENPTATPGTPPPALRLSTPHAGQTPTTPNPTSAGPARTPAPTQRTVDHRRLALQAMYNLPWMEDGATPQERETADRIEALTRYNGPLAVRIISMPFLQTHQITDTGAITALAHLSFRDQDAADQIAAHPALERGITDSNTVPLTLAYGEWLLGANHHRLLEPAALTWHTKEANLPLSGAAAISIATERPTGHSETTAASIEEDLAWVENYLQQPLPTHNVLIHYGSGLRSPIRGANVQASIMQPSSHHTPSSYHWVQHELMHYWFHSNEGWLDEGMAQVLTSLLNANGEPDMLPVTAPSCPTSARIRDLKPGGTETAVGSRCLYAVGERFFSTLYQEAGYDAFRDGARKLAARTNRPPFQDMGLDEVKNAFSESPEALATAMDKWY